MNASGRNRCLLPLSVCSHCLFALNCLSQLPQLAALAAIIDRPHLEDRHACRNGVVAVARDLLADDRAGALLGLSVQGLVD